jgi:hypothetical protein
MSLPVVICISLIATSFSSAYTQQKLALAATNQTLSLYAYHTSVVQLLNKAWQDANVSICISMDTKFSINRPSRN